MRLIRLAVQGFGAFRDASEIDFTDANFFALVGPTGSGKSTVIDAVCFALYGSVPRYEDQRTNRYVLTLGASEARVSLTFELGEASYAATRVVRRSVKGQFSTKEARLERLEESGPSTVLAGAEREMNPAVESLLRLNFEDFTRCVALPQGEFARFLRAKGEERRELLLRLLNLNVYLSVGQRAGQVAAAAKAGVDLRRQQMEALVDATPEALALATKRSSDLKKLNDKAKKARPKIDEHHRLETEERLRENEALGFVQLLPKISVPAKARKHGARLSELQTALKEAEATANAATKVRESATVATKDSPDVAALKTAAAAHGALARRAAEIARTETDVANANKSEALADQQLVEAEAACQQAESHLQAVETAHAAENLAEKLVAASPAPCVTRW